MGMCVRVYRSFPSVIFRGNGVRCFFLYVSPPPPPSPSSPLRYTPLPPINHHQSLLYFTIPPRHTNIPYLMHHISYLKLPNSSSTFLTPYPVPRKYTTTSTTTTTSPSPPCTLPLLSRPLTTISSSPPPSPRPPQCCHHAAIAYHQHQPPWSSPAEDAILLLHRPSLAAQDITIISPLSPTPS